MKNFYKDFQQTVKYEPATHGYGGTSNYKPRSFDTRPGASPSPGIEPSSSLMIRLFKEEEHLRHFLSLKNTVLTRQKDRGFSQFFGDYLLPVLALRKIQLL